MPPTPSRKWLRRSLILLAVVAIGAALLWWLTRPKPIPVLVASVARGTVEATVANTRAGTVEACQRTKLSTIAGGRIELMAVKEGDHVRKGQLLMQLWNDDLQAEQALSRAQLEDRLYGWGEEIGSNTVEVDVSRLRKRFGSDRIETMRGVGYRIPT